MIAKRINGPHLQPATAGRVTVAVRLRCQGLIASFNDRQEYGAGAFLPTGSEVINLTRRGYVELEGEKIVFTERLWRLLAGLDIGTPSIL